MHQMIGDNKMNEKIEGKILDYRESIKSMELFKELREYNLINIKDLQYKCMYLLDRIYEIKDSFILESLSDVTLLPFDVNYGSAMQRLRFDLENECIDSLFLTRVEPGAISDVAHVDNRRIEDAAKFNEIYHDGYYWLDLGDDIRLEEGTFDQIKDFLFNLKYEDIVELLMQKLASAAQCYLDLGGESNIREALRRFEEVLALEKCVKGAESPGTLTAMHMIARCYLKLSGESNTQEALNRFEELLPLVKRIKGEESPDTLTTMRCIALCYLNLEGESNTQEAFNRLDEVRVLLSRIRRRDRSILLDSKK